MLERARDKLMGRRGAALVLEVEKTTLRLHNLAGDGGDDIFLLRCWAEFFGSASPGKFNFNFSQPNARARKFHLGKGSKVIHILLKRSARKSWSIRHLKGFRCLGHNEVNAPLQKLGAWRRALRSSRDKQR